MSLEPDYTMKEVADALGMSERWVRMQVKDHGAAHQKYGSRVRFTAEQVDLLRAAHATEPVPQSITTGRRKRS